MGKLSDKNRPTTIEQLCGNTQAKKYFEEIFAADMGVYLVHGKHGCGKTSFTNIVKTTAESKGWAVHVINCGVDGGIDKVREVKDSIYEKIITQPQIFIWDEFHAAKGKTAAVNALKEMFEIPKYGIYHFGVTDQPEVLKRGKDLQSLYERPEKIQINRPTDDELEAHLKSIAQEEGISIKRGDLLTIVDTSETVRSAINNLEKYATTGELPTIEGEFESYEAFDLVKIILNGATEWKSLYPMLKKADKDSLQVEGLRRTCMNYGKNTMFNGHVASVVHAIDKEYYDTNTAWASFIKDLYWVFNR